MKKIERRTLICLLLTLFLLGGLALFLMRWIRDGEKWVSFPANRHLYNTGGQLETGTILDVNGVPLSWVDQEGTRHYHQEEEIRRATLHGVGDSQGAIGTGALVAFAHRLSRYHPITGAVPFWGGGRELRLTLDSHLNRLAYQALEGKKGAVGVYHYRTGEVICMVSTPAFDPLEPPDGVEERPEYQGVYLNRFLSGTFVPGSILKTMTLTAVLEHRPELAEEKFTCTGAVWVEGERITCPRPHGEMDLGRAFALSCNGVFGQLAAEVGGAALSAEMERAGLLQSYQMDGIPTAAGSFDGEGAVGWAGVGQHRTLVNPCGVMVWMGAIANGGRAAIPHLLAEERGWHPSRLPQYTQPMMKRDTAKQLAQWMEENVNTVYGAQRFAPLKLCAKSGTAEVGGGKEPTGWFCGFLADPQYPYAFAVVVEEGGSGAQRAGEVAAVVLKALLERGTGE